MGRKQRPTQNAEPVDVDVDQAEQLETEQLEDVVLPESVPAELVEAEPPAKPNADDTLLEQLEAWRSQYHELLSLQRYANQANPGSANSGLQQRLNSSIAITRRHWTNLAARLKAIDPAREIVPIERAPGS